MSTPALDRATEALAKRWGTRPGDHGTDVDARAAVSAVLHDPDDPDWLERAWIESSPEAGPGAWDRASERVRERTRHRFDAVRAAILGEA